MREAFPEQQAHPAPCDALRDAKVRGSPALLSLVAWASRVEAETVEQCGAVRITRGARVPHAGQSEGQSHSAIGRMAVKGPHSSQRYS
jgi:hypothetical protein